MLRATCLLTFALFLVLAISARAQTPLQICVDPNATDDATIAACTQVIKSGITGPDLAAAYNDRGIGYYHKNELDSALSDFNRAIEIDPRDAKAFKSRGTVYFRKSLCELALRDYAKSMELDPTDSAYQERGYCDIALGKFSNAVGDLTQAVNAHSTEPYATLWLHIARMRVGADDATEFASNAKALAAEWPHPVVDFYLGRTTSAQAVASAQNNEQRCEASFYVGEWQIAHRQTSSARANFARAAQICPHDFAEYIVGRAELQRLP